MNLIKMKSFALTPNVNRAKRFSLIIQEWPKDRQPHQIRQQPQ
jgi:hypothetical protein